MLTEDPAEFLNIDKYDKNINTQGSPIRIETSEVKTQLQL